MRASSPLWTWLGLALLVFGLTLLLLPVMPALALGGEPPTGAPHAAGVAAGSAVAGLILLLWQRRQGGRGQQ